MLKEGVRPFVPAWSPTGEWITCRMQTGGEMQPDGEWALVSADGQRTQPLGKLKTQHLFSSRGGKTVYGLRSGGGKTLLFSIDLASGKEKILGDLGVDFGPWSWVNPSARFTWSPDGKSFAYGIVKRKSDIWMLEGFKSKPGLLARLGLQRP